MILKKAQAEAINNAMTYINNVGGRIDVRLENARVLENEKKQVRVFDARGYLVERYASQADFSASYGLN